MPSQQTKAHLLLILTQLSYSGWHIMGSQALSDGADPLWFALCREVTATVLMYLFVLYGNHTLRIEREDYLRFLFLGICSFTNVVGTVIALGYLSATRYAIMQPSIPIWGCLISSFLGYERLTPMKTFGICLAVSGAVLIDTWTTGDEDDDSSDLVVGSMLVVVQCLAMACLAVFTRPMVQKYPASCVTFIYYGIGSFITVLVCIGWVQRFSTSDLYFGGQPFAWIALGYATVFATLFAYNALSWAVLRLPPGVVTAYSTLQPVGTVILSIIVWGRMVTLPEVVGGVLVALGLIATVIGRQWEQETTETPENLKTDANMVGVTGDIYVDGNASSSAGEPLLLPSPEDGTPRRSTNSDYAFFSPSKNKNSLRSIFL